MKKITSLLLTLVMVLGTALTSFAADFDFYHETGDENRAYTLEKVMDEMGPFEDVVTYENEFFVEFGNKYYKLKDISDFVKANPGKTIADAAASGVADFPKPSAGLKVVSVSAITKKTISVVFNRDIKDGEPANLKEIVVIAPNGNELIATGTVAVGDKTATYTFQYELNQTGKYTIKDTDVSIDYVTAITEVQTKIKEDNSVYVTGKTVLTDALQISVDGATFVNATLSQDGDFSYTTPIMASGEQEITIKAVKGSTVVEKKVKVTIPAADQASVISAKAINPREVEVVFSQKVEKASAENEDNYKFNYDNVPASTVDKATLMLDEKTVILTVDSDGSNGFMAHGKAYIVKSIKNVLTKSNNQKILPYKGETQLFANTNGPKLLSIMKATDNKFLLAFDKHVKNTAKVRVDGVSLTVSAVTGPDTDPGDYVLTTNAPGAGEEALLKPGVHTVVVADAEDVAGVNTVVQQLAFSISSDTTPPSVQQITPVGFNAFEIQFSEPITNVANLNGLITSEHLKVSKGNFIYPYTVGNAATDGFKSANRVVGKQNTYKVVLNEKVRVGTIDYPLYDEGMNSVSLNVSVKGYKDAVGLVGNLYQAAVTLQKEMEAPYVVSENLNTAAAAVLAIKFNEDLKTAAADIDSSKMSVYDGNNVKLVITNVAVAADVVSITLSANAPKHKIKVVFEAGAVQDLMGNKNNALTTYVDNRVAATPLTITQVHADGHAATVGNGKAGVKDADKNVITINYNEEMDDNAILAANYQLDGAPLPVGTKVEFTDTDKKVVTITLPDEIYAVKVKAVLTLKTDITTADGSKFVATAAYDEVNVPVSLSDNVKPLLTKAQFVAGEGDSATKAIELTFSETIAVINANDAGSMKDFVVIIGGAEYAVTSIGKSIAADGNGAVNTVATDNTVRIAVNEAININNQVMVKVVPVGVNGNTAIDVKDNATKADGATAAGNTLTADTVVTVQGKVAP